MAGERAYALTGDMVLLERAVHGYALDLLRDKDFMLVSVPSLVREEALIGTGQFPAHREETYAIPADDLYLAGTSEVALVGFHSGEVLDHKRLPLRYAGISPCSGGSGQRGPGRARAAAVHQFEKVEQFVTCAADDAESAAGTSSARYRRATAAGVRPGLRGGGVLHRRHGRRQVPDERHQHLATVAGRVPRDAQLLVAARLAGQAGHIRYKDADGTVRFAYTLNNTAVATPRILAALVENLQTSEAQVRVPAVLRPYLGGRELL